MTNLLNKSKAQTIIRRALLTSLSRYPSLCLQIPKALVRDPTLFRTWLFFSQLLWRKSTSSQSFSNLHQVQLSIRHRGSRIRDIRQWLLAWTDRKSSYCQFISSLILIIINVLPACRDLLYNIHLFYNLFLKFIDFTPHLLHLKSRFYPLVKVGSSMFLQVPQKNIP